MLEFIIKMKIGLKNWIVGEIGGKIIVYNWGREIVFGVLKIWGFEKLRF